MYYVNSRYYMPELGKFISPDNINYLDLKSINGVNLFSYCFNDPINYIDFTGNSGFFILMVIAIGSVLISSACQSSSKDDNSSGNNNGSSVPEILYPFLEQSSNMGTNHLSNVVCGATGATMITGGGKAMIAKEDDIFRTLLSIHGL